MDQWKRSDLMRNGPSIFLLGTKDDFDPRRTRMLMQDAFNADDNGTFSLRLIQFLE